MKNNHWLIPKKIAALGLIVYGLGITGCASTASLYSVNMRYDAAQATIPVYLKADDKTSNTIISVAEFTDTRKIDDRLVVGRVEEKDGMKILVLPKYIKATKAIASGIKEYLKKAGYKVADKIEQWDLKEETIPKGVAKILIGGNIEELEIYCRKGFPTHSYKSSMKLSIVFADLSKSKILYKSNVESSSAQEHVSFSEERLGEQASIVLGDAIEKVFEERVVAQKINPVRD